MPVTDETEKPGIGKLLATGRPGIGYMIATVAGTVAAVPVVVGFIALGGIVLAGRALRDVAVGALPSRNGRPARRRRPKRPAGP